MMGIRALRRKAGKEDAEKPFWISFSDLMTALMVLFLVAMAVALIAVTHGLATINKDKEERQQTIAACIADVKALTDRSEFQGVSVHGHSIDFGTLVLFGNDRHRFESPTHEHFVRQFVPRVLDLARSEQCEQWLKRVVVEGFASQTGDYLYNLNLSYLRSQRVLCVLLDAKAANALVATDRKFIQSLFLVGGSSFNTAAGEAARMRRVELRLEFRDLGSARDQHTDIPLDPGAKCPNDLH
ncbi:cell envelope biogenesis protein OmpA [Verminephrobacter aporrectodeae subsp. tuberculatae]|uniref:flagellar motor protein MotB n=1 Tax=Verminephrobacter aporrectodeae TaxID=1110389 RepID=UPI0022383B89|nr:flagellar motor protein MotB [Verminephrobacter aporrectodeae]MCW5255891.1 cell envelope biogenesis protein OmpA [Verminephrobacter aporrectodeae subsp. tuberculatae]MCW8198841.1 cell envelope biogenesis protein OmpA [Verminephrobacter aporrectodeae subsp. tuberculatae]